MLKGVTALIGFAMQVSAQGQPPQTLQIYRDFLKPGSDSAYLKIEEDAAKICAALKCPHPYLGIESLTGSKEVWFFNGYESRDEQKRVVEDYKNNAQLLAALAQNDKRKASLIWAPDTVFADYRRELSRGVPWTLDQGRFLVIAVTKASTSADGTAFETANGTRFIVIPARTREEADAKLAAAGSEANIFAVRPSLSLPSKAWIDADSGFWRSSPLRGK